MLASSDGVVSVLPDDQGTYCPHTETSRKSAHEVWLIRLIPEVFGFSLTSGIFKKFVSVFKKEEQQGRTETCWQENFKLEPHEIISLSLPKTTAFFTLQET